MPATAREPSGTLVLVLCGQPLQNQGVRSPAAAASPLVSVSRLRSLASSRAMRASMRGRGVGVDAELLQALGDGPGDQRRRQVGLGAQQPVAAGVGLRPLAARLVALGLVELAEHVWGAHRRASCRALPSAGIR